jgi:hypothetical protein
MTINILEYQDVLKHKFRKSPKLQQQIERLICHYVWGDYESIEDVLNNNPNSIDQTDISQTDIDWFDGIIDKFFDHKHLFKNIELQLDGFPGEHGTSHQWADTEELNDAMVWQIEKANVLKYQKSILRKYQDLANDDTFLLFQALLRAKKTKSEVSDQLKKIAAWREPEQLNAALQKIVNAESGLNAQDFIESLSEENVNVVYNKAEKVLVKVMDYATSESIGSNQWCISYDNKYWDDYLYCDENNEENSEKQEENSTYFMFDFNRSMNDVLSKVAFTTLPSGKIIAAHNINDECIMDNFENLDIISKEDLGEIIQHSYQENYPDKNLLDMNHLEFELIPDYIKNNVVNPVSFIATYLEGEFEDDLANYMDMESDNDFYTDEGRNYALTSFDVIVDEHMESSLGEHLIKIGDVNYINSIIKVKDKTFEAIPKQILKSIPLLNIDELEKIIKSSYIEITQLTEKMFNFDKVKLNGYENYINEEYVQILIDNKNICQDDPQFKKFHKSNINDLFKILITNEWKDINFINNNINDLYKKLENEDKTNFFKNIQNIPPQNAAIFLTHLNDDKDYNLNDTLITFQDIFNISSSNSIQSGDFSKYKNLIKTINKNVVQRTDEFKGNGLTLFSKQDKYLFEETNIAIRKIEGIAQLKIIPKNKLNIWVTECQNALSTPFRGGDLITLKKRGKDGDTYSTYIDSIYNKKTSILKHSI